MNPQERLKVGTTIEFSGLIFLIIGYLNVFSGLTILLYLFGFPFFIIGSGFMIHSSMALLSAARLEKEEKEFYER